MQVCFRAVRARNSFALWCAVLGSSVLAGCGGTDPNAKPTGDVTITITNGSVPVTSGRVDLETDRPGEGAGAELNSSGVARITGATLGEYSVVVRPPVVVQVPGVPAPPKVDQSLFPAKVRQRKTTPLKIQVAKGSKSETFDLKEVK